MPPQQRWVRDTLAPFAGADGQLEGWEGVIEDITEPRALSADLRGDMIDQVTGLDL